MNTESITSERGLLERVLQVHVWLHGTPAAVQGFVIITIFLLDFGDDIDNPAHLRFQFHRVGEEGTDLAS